MVFCAMYFECILCLKFNVLYWRDSLKLLRCGLTRFMSECYYMERRRMYSSENNLAIVAVSYCCCISSRLEQKHNKWFTVSLSFNFCCKQAKNFNKIIGNNSVKILDVDWV
jgi:hypothetical protein